MFSFGRRRRRRKGSSFSPRNGQAIIFPSPQRGQGGKERGGLQKCPFFSVWRFSSWGREGRPLSTLPRCHTWSGDVGILQIPMVGTVYIALVYVLSYSFAHVWPSGASSRDRRRRRRRRDAARERESPATHEGKAPFPYQ